MFRARVSLLTVDLDVVRHGQLDDRGDPAALLQRRRGPRHHPQRVAARARLAHLVYQTLSKQTTILKHSEQGGAHSSAQKLIVNDQNQSSKYNHCG